MDHKKVKELEKVVVKSYGELQRAITPFLQDSAISKLLVEGFEIIKRQSEYAKAAMDLDPELFGGYMPATPTSSDYYSWVDTLIDRRLNGKREGMIVVWNLPEGKFSFDPFTKKLDQVNG